MFSSHLAEKMKCIFIFCGLLSVNLYKRVNRYIKLESLFVYCSFELRLFFSLDVTADRLKKKKFEPLCDTWRADVEKEDSEDSLASSPV